MPYFPTPPHFLVVISTRNRGASVTSAIESVLENDYPNFEVCLIDQSDQNNTEIAIEPFKGNKRFHYVRSSTRGCSPGRNVGIRQFGKEFIAITDDDCIVPSNWLSEMNKAFNWHANIGVVGGNTIAGEYDKNAGFIPTYMRKNPFLATKPKDANQVRAIGACYGVRYDVWQNLGFFDEMLGTGTPFRSSSEQDFTYKALLAGFYVYETPDLFVIHNGFRTWKEGRALAKRNWFGMGAVHAKYFKKRKWFILRVIGYVFGILTFGSFIKNLIIYRKISGITPIISYWQGFVSGIFTRVDVDTGNYQRSIEKKPLPLVRHQYK